MLQFKYYKSALSLAEVIGWLGCLWSLVQRAVTRKRQDSLKSVVEDVMEGMERRDSKEDREHQLDVQPWEEILSDNNNRYRKTGSTLV